MELSQCKSYPIKEKWLPSISAWYNVTRTEPYLTEAIRSAGRGSGLNFLCVYSIWKTEGFFKHITEIKLCVKMVYTKIQNTIIWQSDWSNGIMVFWQKYGRSNNELFPISRPHPFFIKFPNFVHKSVLVYLWRSRANKGNNIMIA